jgi:hypothetical protein
MLWTAVCSISAAPSFVLALIAYNDPFQILAMLAGIACFIIGYALVSSTPWAQAFRRRPFVLTTLKIGYGTRIGMSLISLLAPAIPPVILPDVFFGVVSIQIVGEDPAGPNQSPFMVYMITMVEGTLWNMALLIDMLIVHGIQRMTRRPPLPDNLCQNCGYDLRASADVCPECGSIIASHAQ